MKKSVLVDLLNNYPSIIVTFTKKTDKTIRVMRATINPELMDNNAIYFKPRIENDDVLTCYDLDIGDFRRIHVAGIISYRVVIKR